MSESLSRDAPRPRNTEIVKLLLAMVLAVSSALAAEGRATAYAKTMYEAGLDPDACFRVRDLAFQKDDLRFYFNEGILLLSKSVDGKRFAAVFSADVPGGDAEVLVFPPHRSERLSLATFIKSPNLNEHFRASVMLFTDDTGAELMDAVTRSGAKRVPEIGSALAQQHSETVRNMVRSYEIRMVRDHFSSDGLGLFYATVNSPRVGNFDMLFDPRERDSVLVGQLVYRESRAYFDTWTSFVSRAVRNGRRKAPLPDVSVQDVRIESTIDPSLAMKARTRFRFTASRDGDSALAFQLSRRMKATEATLDGVPVEIFARDSLRANLSRGDNDLFLTVFPEPLVKGKSYSLEIAHEGTVITTAGKDVYFVTARTSWYPVREADFAPYELIFHHPKNLALVATGEVAEEKTEGDVRTVVHRTSSPIRFAGFNMGQYRTITSKRAGITIEVCANKSVEAALAPRRDMVLVPPPPSYPSRGPRRQEMVTLPVNPAVPDPAARLADLSSEIGGAIEFLSATLGPPPLKTLTVSPIPGAFGQGFPGLLYLSTLAYLNPSERPAGWQNDYSRVFFSELLHAHEVAHQWWGNLVTSSTYQDDWLMEGLANYSAMLVLEKKKGRRALDSVLDEYRTNLLREFEDRTVESAGPIVWGTRLISSQSPTAWRTITYEKGSWILHMLRMRMGDAKFLQMLGELAKTKRFQSVSTEEFRMLAARFLPPNAEDPKLETFFDQWVYGTGIPTLRLEHKVTGKAPKVRIRGTVHQSGAGEEFVAYVPIDIELPGRRHVTHWVRAGGDSSEFTVDLKVTPVRVTLDPGHAVLARK